MGEKTSISWATHTFNPWMGCTKVSPACAHCYAERDMDHRYHKVQWGPHGTRVKTSEANWKKPLKWDRDAAKSGTRPRVLCASLADVFEEWDGPIVDSDGNELCVCHGCGQIVLFTEHCDCDSPKRERLPRRTTMDDLRAELFALIDATPNLDWLLLTKRPENVRRMFVPHCLDRVPGHVSQNEGDGQVIRRRDNVWLGTTVENQAEANKRIPELLGCRALSPIAFVSCEPLLEPIDISEYLMCPGCGGDGTYLGAFGESLEACAHRFRDGGRIDWVITGAETGLLDQVRITDPAWFRELRDQCVTAGVPFHYKQDAINGRAIDTPELDGRRWVEFPEVHA